MPSKTCLSCLCQLIQGFPHLNWRHRNCWHLWCNKYSHTWRPATLVQIVICGKSAGLALMDTQINKTFTPASSDSTGTRISIEACGTSTTLPAEAIWNPRIGNKRQSATPKIRNCNKSDTSIDGKFTNNLVTPPISTDLVSYKITRSSIRGLYARVGMHLASEPCQFRGTTICGFVILYC